MKCHLCDNWIEIHTDPKNAEYLVVNGARKKVETWEPEDTETIRLKDEEEAKKLIDNAFYKLEHSVKDEEKSKEGIPILTQLQILSEKQWADPYAHSQKMRKKFRDEKKRLESLKRADDEIRDRNSLSIPLLPESPEDIDKAKATRFSDHLLIQAQKHKLEINTSSIFKSPYHKSKRQMTKPSSSSSSSSSLIRKNHNKNKNKNTNIKNIKSDGGKEVIAQLTSTISVNTKLKTDPFLKDNHWNNNNGNDNDNDVDEKITNGNYNSNNINYNDDINNNHNNSKGNGDKGGGKHDILIVRRKEAKEFKETGRSEGLEKLEKENITTAISLVSAEYDDDDDDNSNED